MELPTYFADFLAAIRPTDDQRERMRTEHQKLRDFLLADDALGPVILSTFIQGSYRRMTATRPREAESCDVDIIVATTLHEDDYTPTQALEKFRSWLEQHYPGAYELQGRSWGIRIDSEISLDLVPTSAPSEAERNALEWTKAAFWNFPDEPELGDTKAYRKLLLAEETGLEKLARAAAEPAWKKEPLRIPDREAETWQDTHPLEQIRWTWNKSKDNNGHYVNVVKAIKWWRKLKVPYPNHPKSYPLEHMIGDCCPNGIQNVATGIVRTLEEMEAAYRPFVAGGIVPTLEDRGVATHNVLRRVGIGDFATFLDHVKAAASTARKALEAESVKESANGWRELFGDDFPNAPGDDDSGGGDDGGGAGTKAAGGFTPRTQNTTIGGARFAR